MEESATRQLVLRTGVEEGMGWAEIADSGSGLGPGGNGKVPVPEVDTSLPPLPDDATGDDDEEEDA